MTKNEARARSAMKLALEGAANYIDALGGDSRKYRQALAEQPAIKQDLTPEQSAQPQQEPVLVVEVEPDYMSGGHHHKGSKPYISLKKLWSIPIGTKLYTSPPAQQQEPVAYAVTGKLGGICSFHSMEVKKGDLVWSANPAQRKPLTDEEIESINVRLAGSHDLSRLFARAIEAAHGIKENT